MSTNIGSDATSFCDANHPNRILIFYFEPGTSFEVSAVVVKAFKSFQMFPVPDGASGQSCGVMELEGHQYGPWPYF